MSDEAEEQSQTGGRPAPRRSSRLLGVVLVVVAVVLVAAVARTPTSTDVGTLVLRAAAALAVGAVLIRFVVRSLRSMAEPPPPTPAPVDAGSTDVVYECPVCGTRVRLEVAATGKAPKHCGEEMEPRLA